MAILDEEIVPLEHSDASEFDVQNCSIVHRVDEDFKFYIGMTLKCEEEAYDTYNAYAIRRGFGVRIGRKYYNRANELVTCVFLCSCEGFPNSKGFGEETKRERLQYRSGCNARIKFKLTNGLWQVVEFSDEHNHPFVDEKQKHFISSARKLTVGNKSIISSLVDAGVKPKSAFRFLANEAGGIENVGFIEKDCHNFLQARKASSISVGDAQSLIDYFKERMTEDADFFYTFQLDDDGRMTNFFWRDSMCRLHYECFGDVVTFDTTFRTNKHNMICAPFVGVNNHWKNVFFGCAFLCDETEVSFSWLFKVFVESMGGKYPKTIFTDQDLAMSNAIKKVLPSTCHRLCQWHIERNATQKIPHLLGKPEFKQLFNKLMWNCESTLEFDSTWEKMMVWLKHESTVGNSWLDRLYDLREKWCPAFNLDYFSADIRSTQRSESTNRVVGAISRKTMSLREFVKQYETRANEMRDIEAKDDHDTRGKPKVRIRGCGILNHAAKVYTKTIFFKFQDEFLQAFSEKVLDKTFDGMTHVFSMQGTENDKINVVQYNVSNCQVACSCHLFEKLGLLCRHVLRVLHLDFNFDHIPERYVLKRWTRNAKHGLNFSENIKKKESNSVFSVSNCLNELMRKSFAVMSIAATSETLRKIALEHLENLDVVITQSLNDFSLTNCEKAHMDDVSVLESHENDLQVLDPLPKRSKGYNRIKSAIEKKRKKRSKGVIIEAQGAMMNQTQETRLPIEVQPLQMSSSLNWQRNANANNVSNSNQVCLYGSPNMTFTQLLNQGTSNLFLNYNQVPYAPSSDRRVKHG